MATRKTTATRKTEQKTEVKTEQKREQNTEPKSEPKAVDKPESVTLEQALKEEGEGRTPETIKTERNTGGPSKIIPLPTSTPAITQ